VAEGHIPDPGGANPDEHHAADASTKSPLDGSMDAKAKRLKAMIMNMIGMGPTGHHCFAHG